MFIQLISKRKFIQSALTCVRSITNVQRVSSTGTINEIYKQSLDDPDFFGVRKLVNVKDLFDNRVHLGHKIGSLNPHMIPYLYGQRLGICVIDLDQTVERMKDALNFIAHIAFRGGMIMLVNNSKETAFITDKTAKECKEYSHCREFEENTLLNPDTFFGTSVRLPDLVIFLRTQNTVFSMHTAIEHCAKMFIPTVGIVDSNVDPRLITYPVPGNDDTYCATEHYLSLIKQAILAGKSKRKELITKE